MRKYILVLVAMVFALGLLACPTGPKTPLYDAQGEYDAAVGMMDSDLQSAKALFEKVVANASPEQDGIKQLALTKINEINKKLEDEKAEGADAEKAAKELEKGLELMSSKSWTEAREVLEAAYKLDPTNKELVWNLGISLANVDDETGAAGRKSLKRIPRALNYIFGAEKEDKEINAVLKEHFKTKPGNTVQTFIWLCQNEKEEQAWKCLGKPAQNLYGTQARFGGRLPEIKQLFDSGEIAYKSYSVKIEGDKTMKSKATVLMWWKKGGDWIKHNYRTLHKPKFGTYKIVGIPDRIKNPAKGAKSGKGKKGKK